MRRLALVSLVILMAGCGKREAGVVHAQDGSHRFVEIDEQKFGPAALDSNNTNGFIFRVFHDKQTGQEIVCAEGSINRSNRVDSCYLTGRSWK